jgi:4'-phosphopantetheinyl transferase
VARVARSAGCQVWWAHIGCLRPDHEGLIDLYQARRLRRLVRGEDRARLVVAAALARSVIGRELSCSPTTVRFDRTCPTCGGPHGKPVVVDGDGLELSVSHSGAWVVVAVAHQAVGVDVEELRPGTDVYALVDHVLAPSEQRVLQGMPAEAHHEAFLRYWTRKESILKATGDGLRVSMKSLTVSEPAEPAALRDWRGRPDMPGRVALMDTSSPQGDPAVVAVLHCPAVEVREFDGRSLLTNSLLKTILDL